jgi:hypothetical protein
LETKQRYSSNIFSNSSSVHSKERNKQSIKDILFHETIVGALTWYSFAHSSLRHFSKRRNLLIINSICLLCKFLIWINIEDSWSNFSWFAATQVHCSLLIYMTLMLFSIDWLQVDSILVILTSCFTSESTCPRTAIFNSWQMCNDPNRENHIIKLEALI